MEITTYVKIAPLWRVNQIFLLKLIVIECDQTTISFASISEKIATMTPGKRKVYDLSCQPHHLYKILDQLVQSGHIHACGYQKGPSAGKLYQPTELGIAYIQAFLANLPEKKGFRM